MPTYNSVEAVDASAGDGNFNITAPTADACLALSYHYDGDVGDTLASLSYGGTAMTSVISLGDGANGSHSGCDAFFLEGVGNGTQNIAWTWGNGSARTNGGAIILFFVDQVSGTISVLDSAVDGHSSNQLTTTVDSSTTDLVVSLSASYDAGVAVDAFGTLRTADPIEIGPVGLFGRGYTGAGSAVSTTVDQTGESFGSIVTVSLTETVGGGGGRTPQLTLLGVG